MKAILQKPPKPFVPMMKVNYSTSMFEILPNNLINIKIRVVMVNALIVHDIAIFNHYYVLVEINLLKGLPKMDIINIKYMQ